MILIDYSGERALWRVDCDHCGKQITEASKATTLYIVSPLNDRAYPRQVHQDCCRAFEANHPPAPGASWAWEPLEVMAGFLAINLRQIPEKRVRALARKHEGWDLLTPWEASKELAASGELLRFLTPAK